MIFICLFLLHIDIYLCFNWYTSARLWILFINNGILVIRNVIILNVTQG